MLSCVTTVCQERQRPQPVVKRRRASRRPSGPQGLRRAQELVEMAAEVLASEPRRPLRGSEALAERSPWNHAQVGEPGRQRSAALHAAHEGRADRPRQEAILAVGLLPAAPARVAEDVDVRRPEGRPRTRFHAALPQNRLEEVSGFHRLLHDPATRIGRSRVDDDERNMYELVIDELAVPDPAPSGPCRPGPSPAPGRAPFRWREQRLGVARSAGPAPLRPRRWPAAGARRARTSPRARGGPRPAPGTLKRKLEGTCGGGCVPRGEWSTLAAREQGGQLAQHAAGSGRIRRSGWL